MTDLEFYEIRYSGKEAIFLRAFRAIYLGVFFNVMIMASVCLAGIKIGGILLGLTPFECIFYSSLVTVLYSTVGGLRGVIYTDLIQFFVAMVGSIWATYYIINLEEIGGLGSMLSHSSVVDKLSFFPSADDNEQFLIVLIIPIAVQWWAVWLPVLNPVVEVI